MSLCDFIFNAKEVLGFGIALPSFTASIGAITPLKQIFVKLGPGQPPWIDGFLGLPSSQLILPGVLILQKMEIV